MGKTLTQKSFKSMWEEAVWTITEEDFAITFGDGRSCIGPKRSRAVGLPEGIEEVTEWLSCNKRM